VSKGKRLPPPEKKKTSDAEEMENESRALNFLIRKYLIQQGYKLTAITMEEEVLYTLLKLFRESLDCRPRIK
jgi:hypothetical protein